MLTVQTTERNVKLLVAINTNCKNYKTKIVRCPECKARLCDYVIDDNGSFQFVFDSNRKYIGNILDFSNYRLWSEDSTIDGSSIDLFDTGVFADDIYHYTECVDGWYRKFTQSISENQIACP